MKQILLSVYILLTFFFLVQNKIYAQQPVDSTTQITVEQEKDTVEDTFQTTSAPTLTAPQILLSILAPTSFVIIGYLLIKKLKL